MGQKNKTFNLTKNIEDKINYELLYENSGTLNCFFDTDCKLVLYNNYFVKIFGNYIDFLKTHKGVNKYPFYFKQHKERLQVVLKSRKTHVFTTNYKFDKFDVWFEGNYIPIKDEDGKPLGVQIISREITNQKRTEEILRKKDFYLQKAQQLAHFGNWEWNLKTNRVVWSEETYNIFALPPGTEISVKDILRYLDPDDAKNMLHALNEAFINKLSFSFEAKIISADRKLKYLYSIAEPVFNIQGKATHVFGTVQDITERVEAQKIIANSENRYRKLFEMLSDPTFLIERASGQILECNTVALKTYGYVKEEVLAMKNSDLSAEPDKTKKAMIDKAENVLLRWHKKKSGKIFPVEIKASNFSWKGSDVQIAVCRDITERTNAEKSLRDFERIFNLSADLISIVRVDGRVLKINPAVEKILGYDVNEVEGKNIFDFMYTEDLQATLSYIENNVAEKAAVLRIENRYVCKNGEIVWLSWKIQPIYEENISFSVAHDITHLKNIENELIKSINKAEESDKLKTAFLANMSHEIRTPMNGIVGFSDILVQRNISNDKRKYYAEIINRSCNRLLHIINDIIDISKIETGQIDITMKTVGLNNIFDDLFIFYDPIKKPGIKLIIEKGEPENKDIINTDSIKLRQVLDNLINNAMKFTEKGYIKTGYLKNKKDFIFYVRDTGTGIAEKNQGSIFERFVQADENEVRKHSGTGLGLAICKAYINKLGGEIWLESEVNNGTTFYFKLPHGR